MAINLDGLLLPITTPFHQDESIDFAGLTANINKWAEAGVKGYVVLGSTGERVNLHEHEYVEVIEATRAVIPETLTFIVGSGQQSTRATINETERAAHAGAQALLIITPNYYRSAITQETLIHHYSAVADNSPVPIILYSVPDLTGIRIEPETAARLSEHQNIIGMKDSSSDIIKFAEAARTVRERFALIVGNGTVFNEALQIGARGGILAVGCAAPEICLAVYRAFESGDLDRARALQQRLTPLARAVTATYGIGGLKAAMDVAGYVGGAVRAPLHLPNEEARAEIQRLLRDVAVKPALARASEAQP